MYENRPSTQLRLGCCYGVFHKGIIKTAFHLETSFFLSTGRMQCCIEKVFFARSELVGVYVDWKWFLQGCYGICVLTLNCVSTLFELYSQERNDCRGRILTVRKRSRHRRDCCMISASSILSNIQGVPIFPPQDDWLEDGNYRKIAQKRQPSSRLE